MGTNQTKQKKTRRSDQTDQTDQNCLDSLAARLDGYVSLHLHTASRVEFANQPINITQSMASFSFFAFHHARVNWENFRPAAVVIQVVGGQSVSLGPVNCRSGEQDKTMDDDIFLIPFSLSDLSHTHTPSDLDLAKSQRSRTVIGLASFPRFEPMEQFPICRRWRRREEARFQKATSKSKWEKKGLVVPNTRFGLEPCRFFLLFFF
jgi:hypothetical protein